VQYTLRFSLPASLAAGAHKLRVTVGAASAEASFTKAATAADPALAGLDAPIRESKLVTIDNLPANSRATFTVDGKAFDAEADGRSIRIDPYAFDPAASHAITATYGVAETAKTLTGAFSVAPLAPKLDAPTSLPNLQRGDLLRFTVQAQPGSATRAVYPVDGKDAGRSDGPPFEYTVPSDGIATGSHTLSVAFENAAGRSEQSFTFQGPKKAGSPTGAYVLIALAALAAIASVLYGARLAIARMGRRDAPVDLDAAAAYLRSRTMGPNAWPPPVAAEAPAETSAPWGELVVVNGKQAGERFTLTAERELIGSAKTCAIRLTDPSVQPGHAVLTRDPEPAITRSAPNCPVSVDGTDVREAPLAPGAAIRIGAVELRFEAPA
jgi:hypothetical protein